MAKAVRHLNDRALNWIQGVLVALITCILITLAWQGNSNSAAQASGSHKLLLLEDFRIACVVMPEGVSCMPQSWFVPRDGTTVIPEHKQQGLTNAF